MSGTVRDHPTSEWGQAAPVNNLHIPSPDALKGIPMDARTDAIVRFQRVIVQEILGEIPERDIALESTDVCDMIWECAGKLASIAFEGPGDNDPDFERMACDSVSLYSLAVSAVRWDICDLSKEDPMYKGQILMRMMSETQRASYQVRTLSGEFRLTPFRAPEIVNYRKHCHGGRVDFEEWLSETSDREWVENLWAIVQHP